MKVTPELEELLLTINEIGLIGCDYQRQILETGEIGKLGKAIAKAQLSKILKGYSIVKVDKRLRQATRNYIDDLVYWKYAKIPQIDRNFEATDQILALIKGVEK